MVTMMMVIDDGNGGNVYDTGDNVVADDHGDAAKYLICDGVHLQLNLLQILRRLAPIRGVGSSSSLLLVSHDGPGSSADPFNGRKQQDEQQRIMENDQPPERTLLRDRVGCQSDTSEPKSWTGWRSHGLLINSAARKYRASRPYRGFNDCLIDSRLHVIEQKYV